MIAQTCTTCQTPLSRSLQRRVAAGKPHTGLCGKCWHASVRIERNCCDCGKKLANRYAKRCHPCGNALMAKDVEREAHRIQRMREALKQPAVRARRVRANNRAAARKMAWLPDSHREEYFRLLKKFGRATLARAAIMERMTPLERQVSRVMSGARVVAKVLVPGASYAFTLGGVTEALA